MGSSKIEWTHINGIKQCCNVPKDVVLFNSILTNTETDIKSVDFIPSSITNIAENVFSGGIELVSITIPNSVTSIGWTVFDNCINLTKVKVKATTPPNVGSYIFGNTPPNLNIIVPNASVDAYRAAKGWKDCADKIKGYQ